MIIGFGSTETNLQNKLQDEITKYVCDLYVKEKPDYISDAFVEKVTKWVNKKAEESRESAAGYKTAEKFPDRYSSFYATVLKDASHIVFILKFSHINRRHAFSPDGWAMLQSEQFFYIDSWELSEYERKKAA